LSHRGIAMRSLHAQLVVSVGQTMARELEATGRERAVRP